MRKSNLPIVVPVTMIFALLALNILQWSSKQDVSAQPPIVMGLASYDGLFDDDARFVAFKKTITSREFIESILEQPKYESIRDKFLPDWKPEVTKTRISDRYGKCTTLYWGSERDTLSELIDDVYDAIGLEIDHLRSLAKSNPSVPEPTVADTR